MKNVLITLVFISIVTVISILYAQTTNTKTTFPLVNWVSNSSADVVTIENGEGVPLVIQITVTGNANSPGIRIENCGKTDSIKAGSSAICTSTDAHNPVTFNSDNSSKAATGTYQVTKQ